MPKVFLEVSAILENVRKVSFALEPYVLDVQQTGGSEVREGVEVDKNEEHEIFGSKGVANFKMKWDKKDKHEASITVLSQIDLTASRKMQKIASFETRGLELVKFRPTSVFVVSSKGEEFSHCDMSDPAEGWADYDEKAQLPVSVSELAYRFVSG